MNPADPCLDCASVGPCPAHHPALGGTPRTLSPHDEIAALRADVARHVAINEALAADLRAATVDRATFDEIYASLAKAQDQLANADSAVKESIDEQWRLYERAKSAERERDEVVTQLAATRGHLAKAQDQLDAALDRILSVADCGCTADMLRWSPEDVRQGLSCTEADRCSPCECAAFLAQVSP